MNKWDLLWIILKCEAVLTCLQVISEYLSRPLGPVTSHHPDSSPAPPAGVTIPPVHQSIIVTDPSLVSEKMTGELSRVSSTHQTSSLTVVIPGQAEIWNGTVEIVSISAENLNWSNSSGVAPASCHKNDCNKELSYCRYFEGKCPLTLS